MRKTRFTEAQIVAVLNEGEAGVPVSERIRKHGISRNTYFNWISRYGGRRSTSCAGCASWKRRTRGPTAI